MISFYTWLVAIQFCGENPQGVDVGGSAPLYVEHLGIWRGPGMAPSNTPTVALWKSNAPWS